MLADLQAEGERDEKGRERMRMNTDSIQSPNVCSIELTGIISVVQLFSLYRAGLINQHQLITDTVLVHMLANK